MASESSRPLVVVKDLIKNFPIPGGSWWKSDKPVVRAVNGISFSIGSGETLGLVGESGSGKSTTGRLILRLIEATSGSCTYAEKEVFSLSPTDLRALRREMQIIFQDPYGAFNPRMTVGGIISEALELRGMLLPSEKAREIERLLALVQMPVDIENRFPHEFSGGQRQRIGIARALAVDPRFIVADEPVSALDVSTQAEVVNLLLDLQKRLGLTLLFISHDLSVVRILADRIAVMYGGKILELAETTSLFKNPLQPYTLELLASIPEPDPARARRKMKVNHAAVDIVGPAEPGCPYAGRCQFTMDICREKMPDLIDFAKELGEPAPHTVACHKVELDLRQKQ